MNKIVHRFVDLIENNKDLNTKEDVINLVKENFRLVKDGRALYYTQFFAVVFCYSKNEKFSNVVLSLSKLQKYDNIPCFVVLVRKEMDNKIYLINTTFIEKISHSSSALTLSNIRGSFLGSNIRREITEINKSNQPNNFDELFSYHQGFTWDENLERLVEYTNNIKPNRTKAILSQQEQKNLFNSPIRALNFIKSADYNTLLFDLQNRCNAVKDAILVASHIDNVNIRGRLIEALITVDAKNRHRILQDIADIEKNLPTYDTKNDLGDYQRSFEKADTYTDVKTKILYLDSNPKAYNIDKFLKCMGEQKSIFFFFFVGIDNNQTLKTQLCSVYHDKLLDTTLLQHHWAGRGTRGVAQFSGKAINDLLKEDNFINNIDLNKCKGFINILLER